MLLSISTTTTVHHPIATGAGVAVPRAGRGSRGERGGWRGAGERSVGVALGWSILNEGRAETGWYVKRMINDVTRLGSLKKKWLGFKLFVSWILGVKILLKKSIVI